MQWFRRRSLPVVFLLAMIAAFATAVNGYALSEDVTLVAEDGYRITATLTRPENKPPVPSGVVLIHMYRNSRESWPPLIQVLAARGITTLAIDLRGHGASRTAPDGSDGGVRVMNRDPGFFNTMYLDAEAALQYLENNQGIPPQRTALTGASVGCSIAIRAALDHTVAGVVVMTPGKEYLGIPTLDHIKNWPDVPLLILTSDEERDRGADDIYAALKNRGAELMVFDEQNIHGTNMLGRVKNVEMIIADWLSGIFRNAPDPL